MQQLPTRHGFGAGRSQSLDLFRLDINAAALSDAVETLRRQLDGRDAGAFDVVRSHTLYERIVAPAAAALQGINKIRGTRRCVGQPAAWNSGHPRRESVKSEQEYQAIPWFARDYAVTVLPSVSTLRFQRRMMLASAAPNRFIGIGNPTLAGQPQCRQSDTFASVFRGSSVDARSVRGLCPLPETAGELSTLARAVGGSDAPLYLAERATKPIIMALPLDLSRHRLRDAWPGRGRLRNTCGGPRADTAGGSTPRTTTGC